MPEYTKHPPDRPCTRHKVAFSKSEVIEALSDYARKGGLSLPDGECFVWGIDQTRSPGYEESLTLVVDEHE